MGDGRLSELWPSAHSQPCSPVGAGGIRALAQFEWQGKETKKPHAPAYSANSQLHPAARTSDTQSLQTSRTSYLAQYLTDNPICRQTTLIHDHLSRSRSGDARTAFMVTRNCLKPISRNHSASCWLIYSPPITRQFLGVNCRREHSICCGVQQRHTAQILLVRKRSAEAGGEPQRVGGGVLVGEKPVARATSRGQRNPPR